MDWQMVGALAAAVGVMGSFGLTVWQLRQERAIANAAADRSESAARLSEEYTARVVDALERIAHEGLSLSNPSHEPRAIGVRWELAHHQGDRYRLTNVGDAEAADVKVEGHPSLIGPSSVQGGPDLGPGEALTFIAARSMATADSTITVRWADADDPDGVWQYPLPAKP